MSFYSWIAVNSVNVVTKLWTGQPRNYVLIPGKGQEFFSSSPKHPHGIRGTSRLLHWRYQEPGTSI